MRIQLLRSMKDSSGWRPPGAILTIDTAEGRRLISKKAAVELEESVKEPKQPEKKSERKLEKKSEKKVEEEFLTEEELEEISGALQQIEGIDEAIAMKLIENGIQSAEDVVKASVAEIIEATGLKKTAIQKIKKIASKE